MIAMTVRHAINHRSARRERRMHVVPMPARRMRDAGGPEDRACYSCGCGTLFEAPVSTTVSCPACATVQAW
jgi:hypothetical protein